MAAGDSTTDEHEKLFEEVHQTVMKVVKDVVGDDFFEVCEIGLDSSFAEDVELESTEVLQIGEHLMDIYGDKVDFVQWLADLDLRDMVNLTLREFIDFIVAELERHERVGQ